MFQYRKRQVLLQFNSAERCSCKNSFAGFNTASGRYYCNLAGVPIELFIGACFNTASGRYYCNARHVFGGKNTSASVSIPQAVGTIAILNFLVDILIIAFQYRKRQVLLQCSFGGTGVDAAILAGFNTASGRYYCNDSGVANYRLVEQSSFNTASGRYYCNFICVQKCLIVVIVSIPQAVGTIAMHCCAVASSSHAKFQYRKRQVLLQ